MTWADLIVIGAKVATLLEWNEIKEKRNPKGEGGVSVANLFGAEWQIQLGREDATQPDPEVPIPTTDSSVDEIRVSCDTSVKALSLGAPYLLPHSKFCWSSQNAKDTVICCPPPCNVPTTTSSDQVLAEHFPADG